VCTAEANTRTPGLLPIQTLPAASQNARGEKYIVLCIHIASFLVPIGLNVQSGNVLMLSREEPI
jgi:hypothetical protein